MEEISNDIRHKSAVRLRTCFIHQNCSSFSEAKRYDQETNVNLKDSALTSNGLVPSRDETLDKKLCFIAKEIT
jgi:hypothetical protein